MEKRDPKVDGYIAKSADFARPILEHFREIVHSTCPEVEEAMKWSFPHFLYKGMLCGMASFKTHCAVNFWKGALIFKDKSQSEAETAMGHFGRIKKLSDLPSDKIIIGYLKTAMKVNDEGVKNPATSGPKERKELVVPDYFTSALKKNKKASTSFDGFNYSNRKDYVEWITEPKTDGTRNKRMATAIEWLAEGKSRNWKYQNC